MNKRKILNWTILIISSLMVGAAFVTATTYFQLVIAIFLYPLLALFYFSAFPRGARLLYPGETAAAVWPVGQAGGHTEKVKTESVGITDIDKRAFLKLIGGAGLALFLFSIFNKRIEGLFFKSLPVQQPTSLEGIANSGSLAQDQPMDGYSISEIDDNIIAFYGFTDKDGDWYIMREDTDTGSFRYAKGESDFPGNWGNRANLKYNYYSNVFKLN